MIARSLFPAMCLASATLAAPPLTTILDVLYRADGTRFAGTLTISWNSFEAADRSAITTQVTTINVTNGNVRVQLVPTTTAVPPANYTVKYNSSGRSQFTETWAVPSSISSLRIRDVRIASSLTGALGADTVPTTVQESDVAGLVSDLNARPLRGPAYAEGRVAVVNPSGLLESATGSPSDCVRVDGSSGPCSGAGGLPSFVDSDSLIGIANGINAGFLLTAFPNPPSSLALYRNGVLQTLGQDYTAIGNIIQFAAAATPQTGDTLLASYRLGGVDSGPPPPVTAAQVLCSGAGAANITATFTSLATCSIPAGVLLPGDRVQIHFDLDHQGTAGGFTVEVHWGATTVVHRDAAALDVQMTGRAEAAILAAGAQWSSESWGTLLPFNAAIGSAADAYATGITVDFQGKVIQAGETLTLRNYTVVKLP